MLKGISINIRHSQHNPLPYTLILLVNSYTNILTKEGEREPREPADCAAHLPAQLGRGHCVHRETQEGDEQLTHGQVHQQQVKITPQLNKENQFVIVS